MKTLWTIIKTTVILMMASCTASWLLMWVDENFRRGVMEACNDK